MGSLRHRQWLVLGGATLAAVTLYDLLGTLKDRKRLETCHGAVNGWRLHWRQGIQQPETADRLPVVLVHGYGISSSYMIPTAARLASSFPVYAPDLPGHGLSEKPGRVLDVPQLADVLVSWMDLIGLDRVALLGHSMGCQIAVNVAVHYPSRVDRLIMVAPTVDRSARNLPQQIGRLVMGAVFERPSLSLLLLWDYGRAGPRRMIGEAHHMLRDSIEHLLPQVDIPVLVVRGKHDTIVPKEWAEEVARLARAERLVVIPRRGHAVNYSAPDQLLREILSFLEGSDHCVSDQ